MSAAAEDVAGGAKVAVGEGDGRDSTAAGVDVVVADGDGDLAGFGVASARMDAPGVFAGCDSVFAVDSESSPVALGDCSLHPEPSNIAIISKNDDIKPTETKFPGRNELTNRRVKRANIMVILNLVDGDCDCT